jgi:hypothetical protein
MNVGALLEEHLALRRAITFGGAARQLEVVIARNGHRISHG